MGIITGFPERVIVCAHFLRADLFTFAQAFKKLKTVVQGVRKTVATLDGYGIDVELELSKRIDSHPYHIWEDSNKSHTLNIRFVMVKYFWRVVKPHLITFFFSEQGSYIQLQNSVVYYYNNEYKMSLHQPQIYD